MKTSYLQDQLLSPAETAEYLKTTVGTLAVWRTTGNPAIPFIKIGRKVLYKKKDVDKWLDSKTVTHTLMNYEFGQ